MHVRMQTLCTLIVCLSTDLCDASSSSRLVAVFCSMHKLSVRQFNFNTALLFVHEPQIEHSLCKALHACKQNTLYM
jgi:hypothetical protein